MTTSQPSVRISVTNRAGKTQVFEINDRRREIYGGSSDEETAVEIAVAARFVQRHANPLAVVRLPE
jgi:hypothetical protein